ncbi:MAG: PilN domain-containing protein [Fibromonadaceae bacterium]|jgi:type IV pilus assembly protein PilN|nr:PilN domain-containing protein [Fibromonadaceae bacterium]
MAGQSKLLEINLLPSEFKHKKLDLSWLSDSRVIWSTLAIIVAAVVMSLLYVHITETIDSLEKEVTATRQAVDKERHVLKQIEELEAKQKEIAQRSTSLRAIQVNRKRWVVLLENLSTTLPPNTWITNITQNNENQMNMKCSTWNFPEVALYMLRLEQEASVNQVSLTEINAVKQNNEEVYNFSLTVDFDQNVGVEAGAK